ncbi:hypothetical protein Hanom_Chr06g00518731 [Helianthus anomalus]
MPSERDTAFPLRDGQITLFVEFFKFCNFRLPITKFCKSMLDEYAVHISQMHPLGLAKLYADVIPREMHRRVMVAKEKVKNVVPPKAEYQENALFKTLIARPSKCLVVHEGVLALVGMSLCWSDVQTYPTFKTADGVITRVSCSLLCFGRLLIPGEVFIYSCCLSLTTA